VESELLARQGRLREAAAELRTAERLEPGLPFAKPQAVQELERRVGGSSNRPAALSDLPVTSSNRAAVSGSIPWRTLMIVPHS